MAMLIEQLGFIAIMSQTQLSNIFFLEGIQKSLYCPEVRSDMIPSPIYDTMLVCDSH